MLRSLRTLPARLSARTGDLRDERGSILLEALASAVLLAVLTLAVLQQVDGASEASGRTKARTAAAQLAEQDQERMRGMRFIDLSNYRVSRTVPVDGVNYAVESRTDWIRDATGSTESCTNDSTQSNYLRIRSTVTSDIVGVATKPVVIDSLVAPPVDTFDPDQGTLAVKLLDRDGNAVVGKNVTISGQSRTLSDVTNSLGCAVFAFIAKGDYTITLPAPGWVSDKPIPTGKVIAGQVNVLSINYDQAATVTASFKTQLPGVDTAATTPVYGWKLSGDNIGLGGIPSTADATPTAPAKTVTAPDLYPFATAYSFYSGDCQGPADEEFNAPTKKAPTYYATHPGLKALNPGDNVALDVIQPAVKLKVINGGGGPPTNATVTVRSTSSQCTFAFPMVVGSDGLIRKPSSITPSYDPSLPFGRYKIDVAVPGRGTKSVTVNNTNPGGAMCTQMDVSLATPAGGATCP